MYKCVLYCQCNMIGLSANSGGTLRGSGSLLNIIKPHLSCVVDQNPISVTRLLTIDQIV